MCVPVQKTDVAGSSTTLLLAARRDACLILSPIWMALSLFMAQNALVLDPRITPSGLGVRLEAWAALR